MASLLISNKGSPDVQLHWNNTKVTECIFECEKYLYDLYPQYTVKLMSINMYGRLWIKVFGSDCHYIIKTRWTTV